MSIFDEKLDRRGTACLKWDYADVSFGAEGVIPMWVADMDFPTPKAVTDAIIKRAGHGAFGYTGTPQSYYDAVIGWMRRRHGWDVQKDWIMFTPGVIPALYWAVEAFTGAEDKVLVQSPVYYMFYNAVKAKRRVCTCNLLRPEGGRYVIDFADLEEKLADPAVTLFILCSPHNPVGRVWSEEELGRIGELCLKHQVLLVSDEIHSDLVFPGHRHIPAASLSPEIAANTITLTAPSKTFNLAGLNHANAIISDPELRERFRAVAKGVACTSPSVFGLVTTEAAYNHGEPWLEELLAYLQGNFDYLKSFLEARIPKIKALEPEATYLIWLDCSALGMEDKALKAFLNQKARVALDDGSWFGGGGSGFARMNIACHRSTLEEALLRLEAAVNEL